MKNWKKIMSLGLAGVLSLSLLTACGGGDSTASAAPSEAPAESQAAESAAPALEKLVLGTSADYPPYEFHILDNGEDKIVGADIALAKEIAADMGVELKIVDMNFDSLLTMLGQGKCDMVIACTESTPDREAAADSSDPYYEDLPPMIVVKKADLDKYTALEDFTGKNVGAQTGTNKALIVTGEDEEVAPIHMTGANPILLTNVGDLINQLANGKCDAVVLDGAVAEQYAEANDDLAIVDIEIGESGLPCVWVANGDPMNLLPSINETIARLMDEEAFPAMLEEAEVLSDQAMG